MTIAVIMNVVDQKKFLDKYSCVFTSSIDQKELADYVRLRHNDKDCADANLSYKFDRFVQESGGKSCPQLPILDVENTQRLAGSLYYESEKAAEIVFDILKQMEKKLNKNWTIFGPNLLVHVIIGFIWQYIWSKMTVKEGGGTVTFIDSPHESYILFPRTVSLDTNQLLVYWQTRLTYNDYVYYDIFNRPNMIKTLRSMDENETIVPYGGVEETLLKMNLLKRASDSGSHASAYRSNIPRVDMKDLEAIKEELEMASNLAFDCFPKVIDIIINSRKDAFKDMMFVGNEDVLQAGFYVWSYLIFGHMKEQGLI